MERLLQTRELARIRKPFDRLDVAAVCLHGEHQAAAHDLAVHAQRARAADAVLATDVRAREAKLLAQKIDEVQARSDAALTSTPLTVSVVSTSCSIARARGQEGPGEMQLGCAGVIQIRRRVEVPGKRLLRGRIETFAAAAACLARMAFAPTPKNASRISESLR
jgi:hypothetical protein